MKKVVLISSVLLTFVIGIYFYYYSDSQKYVLESGSSNPKIVSSNSLTMMYETEYQSGEYQVASDTTWPQDGYIFNETLSKCENGGVLSWDNENKKVLLQTNTSDKCYVYFDKEPDIIYLADYIINNVYTGTDGDNGLYYHDGVGTYTNADQEAGDYSYRYSGANPNNYVCFGSDEVLCPEDNLYRIIGVFDNEVKIIKADYALEKHVGKGNGYYYPAASYSPYQSPYTTEYYKGNLSISEIAAFEYIGEYDGNSWNVDDINTDALNTIYVNYLNSISTKWVNFIKDHEWKSGGFGSSYYNSVTNQYDYIASSSVKTLYDYEVGINSLDVISIKKIGLMYFSDCSYASEPNNWNIISTNNINDNWLVMGLWELTISLHKAGGGSFMVTPQGNMSYGYAMEDFWCAIRPSFYLIPDVQYISGSGTQTDPFRIA